MVCHELSGKSKFRRSNICICGSFRLLLLLAAATCALLAVARVLNAQEPSTESWKFQPLNQARSIKAEPKTQVLSSAEREAIASAISRSASAGAAQINEPVVQATSAGTTSLVLNVEFISEAARLNFTLLAPRYSPRQVPSHKCL
jgi:hypothetical protein